MKLLALSAVFTLMVVLVSAVPMPSEEVQPEQKHQPEVQTGKLNEPKENLTPEAHHDQNQAINLPADSIEKGEKGENANRSKRFIFVTVEPATYSRYITYTVPAATRVETTYIIYQDPESP